MTTTVEKNVAFEYYVIKLHKWYSEVCPEATTNDLSVLKILKLLFFGTAISSEQSESLLDTVFSNFCAMPFGHVESDIYKLIKLGTNFKHFSLSNSTLILNQEYIDHQLIGEAYKDKIDYAINKLVTTNTNLIKMSSSDLVNLSHEWYSWKFYFSKARRSGLYSAPIPIEIIKKEQKYFSL